MKQGRENRNQPRNLR